MGSLPCARRPAKGMNMTGYFNARELAQHLGISMPTVQRWRKEGKGPPYIKIGQIIRYEKQAVEAWLDKQSHAQSNQWRG